MQNPFSTSSASPFLQYKAAVSSAPAQHSAVFRYKLAVTQEDSNAIADDAAHDGPVIRVPPGWTLLTRDRETNKTVIVRNLPKRGIQRKRAGEKYAEDL